MGRCVGIKKSSMNQSTPSNTYVNTHAHTHIHTRMKNQDTCGHYKVQNTVVETGTSAITVNKHRLNPSVLQGFLNTYIL